MKTFIHTCFTAVFSKTRRSNFSTVIEVTFITIYILQQLAQLDSSETVSSFW